MNFKRKLQAGLIKPVRNRAYLDYVKSLECPCGNPADDAHHIIDAGLGGTMGGKASDLLAMPVCRMCHNAIHENVIMWEMEHGLQWMWVCLTLAQAQNEGVLTI